MFLLNRLSNIVLQVFFARNKQYVRIWGKSRENIKNLFVPFSLKAVQCTLSDSHGFEMTLIWLYLKHVSYFMLQEITIIGAAECAMLKGVCF